MGGKSGWAIWLWLAGLGLAACTSSDQDDKNRTPVRFEQIQGWESGDFAPLPPLMEAQCQRMALLHSSTTLGGHEGSGSKVGDWRPFCSMLQTRMMSGPLGSDEMRRLIGQWFDPFIRNQPVALHGYYEPEIQASPVKSGEYAYPVYSCPPELIRRRAGSGRYQWGLETRDHGFQPFAARAEIDAGSLKGRNLEIAWVKKPQDVFFLQLQGAGRLLMPDGAVWRVAYDGTNGQKPVPLGRVLIDRGWLADQPVSLAALRQWFVRHPLQTRELLEADPSYVFFRRVGAGKNYGPPGAFGLPLSVGRALAADHKYYPFALPVWLQTCPEAENAIAVPRSGAKQLSCFARLTFVQDSSADIQGDQDIAVFTGWGENGLVAADRLPAQAQMVILSPRRISRPDPNG